MNAFDYILWDASRLVKRYIIEIGSETVDAIFTETVGTNMSTTPWGYLETYAILQRRYRGGAFDYSVLSDVLTSLQADVVLSGDFGLISISENAIFSATSLLDTHPINSADAAIQSSYLRFQSQLPLGRAACLLVAADKRLLRAAEADGSKTLNPELLLPEDVPAFLATL